MYNALSFAQSQADTYRELAVQATNIAAIYRAKAEQYMAQSQSEIATRCQELADEAVARAVRYMVLAGFAHRNAENAQKQVSI